MSAIFGFAQRDGKPASAETLGAMDRASADWGPDGTGSWLEGPCALGQRLLHTTPESAFETMPLTSRQGNIVLVAAARLDNRADLFGALGVPQAERAMMPDGALILRAYERWGEQTPARLLGDWAFAAWDRQRQRLFVARDQYGVTALYYYASPRLVAFASCHAALLASPGVPRRLNELHVAEIFFGWPGDGTATLWEDVRRLPPAHCVSISASGVAVREYWRLQDAPEIRLGSDGSYLEQFRALYDEAVRCRLRSQRPLGSTLSAGLDSSSVTALAARELRLQGRQLVAFTAAPRDGEPHSHQAAGQHLVDEWPLACEAAAHIGVAEHVKVGGENASPLDALEHTLAIHSEPAPAALGHYWVHSMLTSARQRGIGTLLVGQFGNGTVSWSGGSLAHLHLAARSWPRLWLELIGESRAGGGSVPRVAWRRLMRPALAAAQAQLRWRFGPPPGVWARHTPIDAGFLKRSRIREHMHRTEPLVGRFSARTPREQQRATLMPGVIAAGAFLHELGAAYGLDIRDPTADLRLIEFCFRIPPNQHFHNGQGRWLMRRAMKGLLPESVRCNTRRGVQSPDLERLARCELAGFGRIVAQIECSPTASQYLSLPLLRRLWHDLQDPASPDAERSAYYLLGMLSVGLFLMREERAAA